MFISTSCSSTSTVCLVSIFLIVTSSCVFSLPVVGNNSTGIFSFNPITFVKNVIQPLTDSETFLGIFRNKCLENGAEPKEDLKACVVASNYLHDAIGRLHNAEMPAFLMEYCRKRPILEHCVTTYLDEARKCLKDGIKDSVMKLNSIAVPLTNWACSKERDILTQFMEDGGFQCVVDAQAEIQNCFNKTISPSMPLQVFTTGDNKLGLEECTDIRALQKCSLKILRNCEKATAAIFIDTLLNVTWNYNCRDKYVPTLQNAADEKSHKGLQVFLDADSTTEDSLKSRTDPPTPSEVPAPDNKTRVSSLRGREEKDEDAITTEDSLKSGTDPHITSPELTAEEKSLRAWRKRLQFFHDADYSNEDYVDSDADSQMSYDYSWQDIVTSKDSLDGVAYPQTLSDYSLREQTEDLMFPVSETMEYTDRYAPHNISIDDGGNISTTISSLERSAESSEAGREDATRDPMGNDDVHILTTVAPSPVRISEINNDTKAKCFNPVKHVDPESVLNNTSLLVISSYVVLSVIIVFLIAAMICDRLSEARRNESQPSER